MFRDQAAGSLLYKKGRHGLTVQVAIVAAEDLKRSVQSVLAGFLARVQLLDGLQKLTEAVIGQPLPAQRAQKSAGQVTD